MKKTASQIRRSFQQQELNGSTERDIWREVYAYTVPQKSKYYSNYVSGEGVTETYDNLAYLYDSIGVNETVKTASSFSSYIVSPHSEWFSLEPSDPSQSDDVDFRSALQRITAQAHKELRNTNFHQNVQENFIDLTTIGNSAYIIEKGDGSGESDLLAYIPIQMTDFYWIEDDYGRPSIFWRLIYNTAFDIITRYFPKGEELNEESVEKYFNKEIASAFMGDDYEHKFQVIHHAYPIDPRDLSRKASMSVRYYSQHVLRDGKGDKYLSDMTLRYCPYGTYRGLKIADSPYGIGQGLMALPNLKTQQKIGRSLIISAQKTVEPPFMVPANPNYVRSYTTHPNAKLIVDMVKGEKVEILSDFRMQELFNFFANHRQMIREIFHAPELDITKGQYETARATAVNAETSLKVLTPIVARLERETFSPIINRVVEELRENASSFNLEPEFELLKEVKYRVRFSSDIAINQRLKALQSFQQALAMVKVLAEQSPSVLDNVNYDKALKRLWDILDQSFDVLNPEDRVEGVRMAREEAENAEADRLNRMNESETSDKLTKAGKNLAQGVKDMQAVNLGEGGDIEGGV